MTIVRIVGFGLFIFNAPPHHQKNRRNSQLWKSVFWITSWNPFCHQNVGINLVPCNTKFFNIKLFFRIFLNHLISILESKIMVKILELRNHTKSYEKNYKSHKLKIKVLSLPPPLPTTRVEEILNFWKVCWTIPCNSFLTIKILELSLVCEIQSYLASN